MTTVFAVGAVSIKTEIPSFKEPSSSVNPMMGIKTIWELCLFQRDPLSHFRGYKWRYLFFRQRETGTQRVTMATILTVSFCSFCDAHLWCQVSRTLLQYFQRYFLFSILSFFSYKSYDVITYLICTIQKCQHLWNEKRYFEKKNAILLYFERPFK